MTDKKRVSTDNPWLDIPAADYEGHMSLPEVGQARFLSDQFKLALSQYDPTSVALLGCATGNGLEHITLHKTEHLAVVDINQGYLEILQQKFAHLAPVLDVINTDLAAHRFEDRAFTLMIAGLVFEYLPPQNLLKSAYAALEPGGALIAILQLPSEKASTISNTPYQSLTTLAPIMRLVEPTVLTGTARSIGFSLHDQTIETLASGKSFAILTLKK